MGNEERPPRPELEPGCECAYVWEPNYRRWVLSVSRRCPVHKVDPGWKRPGRR